jgi:hypothetical protein
MGVRAGRVSSEVQVPAPAPRSEIAPSDAAFARLVICIACLLLSWIIRPSVSVRRHPSPCPRSDRFLFMRRVRHTIEIAGHPDVHRTRGSSPRQRSRLWNHHQLFEPRAGANRNSGREISIKPLTDQVCSPQLHRNARTVLPDLGPTSNGSA